MKLLPTVAFLLSATLGWAQTLTLDDPAELTLDAPWRDPVLLTFSDEGPFRLEAAGLGGEPVEVLVERRSPDGTWKVVATNRSLRGVVEPVVDVVVAAGEFWRARPPQPVSKTVILRLKKSVFAALKETLKRDLSVGPEVSLPLRKRLELPRGTGGSSLTAATGPHGELWVAWLTPDQGSAEVWDAGTGRRLGGVLSSRAAGGWQALQLEAPDGPVLLADSTTGSEARAWTGGEWIPEAAPVRGRLNTVQGTFRFEVSPTIQIWRLVTGGWQNLELPRDRMLDRLLLGSTDDGLYALLGSSTGRERALFLWRPQDGWTAVPPPSASVPPRPNLWAATSGAGSLYVVEGNETGLTLRQFDGTAWRAPLDLAPLVQEPPVAVVLLPPSPWSKTGTLIVATTRVAVYDLP